MSQYEYSEEIYVYNHVLGFEFWTTGVSNICVHFEVQTYAGFKTSAESEPDRRSPVTSHTFGLVLLDSGLTRFRLGVSAESAMDSVSTEASESEPSQPRVRKKILVTP